MSNANHIIEHSVRLLGYINRTFTTIPKSPFPSKCWHKLRIACERMCVPTQSVNRIINWRQYLGSCQFILLMEPGVAWSAQLP